MTHMSLRTVTIDLGNLRGQIFSRTEFAPSANAGRASASAARNACDGHLLVFCFLCDVWKKSEWEKMSGHRRDRGHPLSLSSRTSPGFGTTAASLPCPRRPSYSPG